MLTPAFVDGPVSVYCGDALTVLRQMPSESVHMACTSPPYWGLRDYGTGLWEGGDPDCDHSPPAWSSDPGDLERIGAVGVKRANSAKAHQRNGGVCRRCGAHRVEPTIWGGEQGCAHRWGSESPPRSGRGNKPGDYSTSSLTNPDRQDEVARPASAGAFCQACGAWRGALGLEPTPELYVEHLVEVFREVRRVLRADGTAWLNLGDSYATGAGRVGEHPGGGEQGDRWTGTGPTTQPNRMPIPGLKPKDLVGVPWRVAFALQADGWWLRRDVIWAKANPMPESVEDRPTSSHEYLFLLAKRGRYYYDGEAVREPITMTPQRRPNGRPIDSIPRPNGQPKQTWPTATRDEVGVDGNPAGRNLRSVWTIATQPYPEAHFATFPEALVIPCVQAGSSERGCCPECGAPWRRVVERSSLQQQATWSGSGRANGVVAGGGHYGRTGGWSTTAAVSGWEPGCGHHLEPVPCTVLDPFAGSGTTLAVARRLGRRAIGVELQADYLKLIRQRVHWSVRERPTRPAVPVAPGQLPLLEPIP